MATRATATVAANARSRQPLCSLLFSKGQPASGEETEEPVPRRRFRITTTPTEIAARTASAIRIGTSGEEELLLAGSGLLTFLVLDGAEAVAVAPPLDLCAAVEPLPGLLWPEFAPLPVLGLLVVPADALFEEEPDPALLDFAVGAVPPPLEELLSLLLLEFAEPLLECCGGLECPVTVGTTGLY